MIKEIKKDVLVIYEPVRPKNKDAGIFHDQEIAFQKIVRKAKKNSETSSPEQNKYDILRNISTKGVKVEVW